LPGLVRAWGQARRKEDSRFMLTGDQYKSSLNDGRRVYWNGKRVTDLTGCPALKSSIDAVARTYDAAYRPGDRAVSELLQLPTSADALAARMSLHTEWLTEISFMCVMTALTAASRIAARCPERAAAIRAYVDMLQHQDLRITECITDAKGDRSLAPGKQHDADAYLRVVERRPGGIVVRGAKLHVSHAAIGHELLVMPTKAMKPDEGDYAVAFAASVNSPGISIVTVGEPTPGDPRDFPFSSREFVPQCFVIFDDVFIPDERVFLDGEPDLAATFAHALGLWTRAGGLVNLADDADCLVGFAQLIAEANGLDKFVHIREKISDMVIHATIIRATLEASLKNCERTTDGMMIPDELFANAGKYLHAANWSLMIRHLQDIGGGSVLTSPSISDCENDEIGALVQNYMRGKQGVDGRYRLRLLHAIRDYTLTSYGSYKSFSNLHGGGGLYAQRLVTRNRYDMERAKRLALKAADLSGAAP